MKLTNVNQRVVSLILICCLGLVACKEKSVDPGADEDAPVLPPEASLVMPLGEFPAAAFGSIEGRNFELYAVNGPNHTVAATKIVAWSIIIGLNMVVPVAAFRATINTLPTFEDGAWVWRRTFVEGSITHTAELRATIVNIDQVDWEMYVSKENDYQDFLWYTGTSDILVTAGTWQLNLNPANPQPYLDIEWHRNPEDATGDIKYTYVLDGAAGEGSSVFYGYTSDAPYDAFYDILNTGLSNNVDIEWNRSSHNGRIRDINHFQDSDWHCWDENLEDIDCP